jgi:electron transfer flavoprotein alpha subunit
MKALTILFNDQDEFSDSCLEIFSFINSLDNNTDITCLNFGGDKKYLSKLPVDNNFYVDLSNANTNQIDILKTIEVFLDDEIYDFIIFQKDDFSNYIAPVISYRKNYPYIPDIKQIFSNNLKDIKFVRPIHGESAEGIYSVEKNNTIVLKIRKNSFEKQPLLLEEKNITELLLKVVNNKPFKIIETFQTQSEGLQLDDAKIVVSGGRGIGGKEGFENLRSLANILNGAVGASRAAVEAEWIEPSNLVGLTGKWISPNLYITFGISGASQHLAGCSNSKNIVSVNTDPDASIFNYSKFGIVEDCNKFIIDLIEELKKTS